MLTQFNEILNNDINNINVIPPQIINDNKYNCVFGVYLTDEGKKIQNEMMEYLPDIFNVYIIQQLPSENNLFEYPALKFMELLINNTNKSCCYIHSKGAANPTPIQKKIREFWKKEILNYYKIYFNSIENDNIPLVSTMFTGEQKHTWFNCFFANKNVFKNNTIYLSNDRYYYEKIFNNTNVNVIGKYVNDANQNNVLKIFKYI